MLLVIYIATAIGHALVDHAVYESQLKTMSVPMLQEKTTHPTYMSAKDIMTKHVECVNQVEYVANLLCAVKTSHNAYPVLACKVVDKNDPNGRVRKVAKTSNYFLGLINKKTILAALRRRDLFHDDLQTALLSRQGSMKWDQSDVTNTRSFHVADTSEFQGFRNSITTGSMHGRLGNENSFVAEHDYKKVIDLGPFLDTGTYVVHEETPIGRVHRLFHDMGLRHLVVIDAANTPCGMITRKDLITGMRKQVEVNLDAKIQVPHLIRKSSTAVVKQLGRVAGTGSNNNSPRRFDHGSGTWASGSPSGQGSNRSARDGASSGTGSGRNLFGRSKVAPRSPGAQDDGTESKRSGGGGGRPRAWNSHGSSEDELIPGTPQTPSDVHIR